MNLDSQVRAVIRADLRPEVFRPRPLRCLLMIPLLGCVVGGSLAVALAPLPWYAALVVSTLVGNFYASMLFLGHEIGHGAAVRSRRLQRLLLYPGCAIFLLSPWLWLIWHNGSHHGHTNKPDEDPDLFGTLDGFLRRPPSSRLLIRVAFGSAYWPSAIYLFCFFSLEVQAVLWWKSRTLPGYRRLNRRRAVTDTALLAAFWIIVAIASGPRGAVFVVLVPMLVANFVVLSYVVTNHMLRSLSYDNDTLATTMSVTTAKLFDRLHFHFSHHVEHHLFPAMSSSMAPQVRGSLIRHFGDRYVAPPHWRALMMVFRTPRFYDGHDRLIEPWSGRRKEISQVESDLRAHQTVKAPTGAQVDAEGRDRPALRLP
jgi:fatty acid desaturase